MYLIYKYLDQFRFVHQQFNYLNCIKITIILQYHTYKVKKLFIDCSHNIIALLEMQFTLVALFLIQLAIVATVSGNPVNANKTSAINDKLKHSNTSDITDSNWIKESSGQFLFIKIIILESISVFFFMFLDTDKLLTRIVRDCVCKTTTGRCVSQGNYQCYFVNGASIVQCVHGVWKLVSKCDGTCKTLHNDRPYCL